MDSETARQMEELRELRHEVELQRSRAQQEDEGPERATYARVEEQCMLLRALLDLVTGSGELSKASVP